MFDSIRRAAVRTSSLAVLVVMLPVAAWAQQTTFQFDIPAEDLGTALRAFAHITGEQLAFDSAATNGKQSTALAGSYGADQALSTLLSASGLTAERAPSGVLMVKPKNAKASDNEGSTFTPAAVETIMVTGSRIRGAAPAGSPLTTYTIQNIESSGVATLDAFIEKLPQNFAGAASQETFFDSRNTDAGANAGAGAAVNLRGLGNGSTLVLLNGQRLAPAGTDGSFVDITLIPQSAIERIDVLTDGASAIYGSDAVAGVVNFITRNDYSGAETDARYGTDGKDLNEVRVGQTVGNTWDTGGFVATYQYYQRDPLLAGQRGFAYAATSPGETLLPGQTSNAGIISGHDDFAARLTLYGTALFSDRQSYTASFDGYYLVPVHTDNQAGSVVSGGDYQISPTWSAHLTVNYGWTNEYQSEPVIAADPFDSGGFGAFEKFRSTSVETSADGSLFALPGGDAKVAVGASYRLESTTALDGTATADSLSRSVDSGYAELSLPFVSADNAIPMVSKLVVSVAGRYDRYSDFGDSFVPKFGMSYGPADWIDLRGSFGKSFRAPQLQDLINYPVYYLLNLPNSASPTGSTLTLINASYGNPTLRPERSNNWTTGFDVRVPDWPVDLSTTYYNIHYTDRIAVPAFSIFDYLDDPSAYGGLVIFNPSPTFVAAQLASGGMFGNYSGLPYPGSTIQAYIDDRINNVSIENETGFDLAVHLHPVETEVGQFSASIAATYILSLETAFTPASPFVSDLNNLEDPNRLRIRAQTGFTNGPWSLAASLNYVGSYVDSYSSPSTHVAAWTTVDAQVTYNFDGHELSALAGTSVSISAINLFKVNPPYVPDNLSGFGYDPSNANPMGRFIAIDLRKAW